GGPIDDRRAVGWRRADLSRWRICRRQQWQRHHPVSGDRLNRSLPDRGTSARRSKHDPALGGGSGSSRKHAAKSGRPLLKKGATPKMNVSFFNRLSAIALGSFSLATSTFALVPPGNDNPTGSCGVFNGNSNTGCSYDPYTGNATRTINDLVVSQSVGAYPLQ